MKKYFENKKDSKFTTQEIKYIWNYASENYLHKSKFSTEMSFLDLIDVVSDDLGLTPNQVRAALSQIDGTKEILDELERKQNELVQSVKKTKDWLNNQTKENN